MSIFRRTPEDFSLDRLSSGASDLDSFQRELLEAIPTIEVPPHAKDAVWSVLALEATHLPPQRLSVLRRALRAGAAKGGIALSTMLALAAAAFVISRRSSPLHAPSSVALTHVIMSAPPSAPATAAIAPVAAASADATARVAAPEKERAGTASLLPHRVTRQHDDDLDREVALLARARAELRAGDPRATLSTLAQMRNQFFGQERSVLGILAQAAIGNKAAAQQAAVAFVKAHPESPHAAELRHLLAQD